LVRCVKPNEGVGSSKIDLRNRAGPRLPWSRGTSEIWTADRGFCGAKYSRFALEVDCDHGCSNFVRCESRKLLEKLLEIPRLQQQRPEILWLIDEMFVVLRNGCWDVRLKSLTKRL
jgi:hypothetical protein